MADTSAKKRAPAAILIVEAEDVFSECLMHFPAGRYALLFAVGAAEAMSLVESRSPKLIILPTEGPTAALAEVLGEINRANAPILGLLEKDTPDATPPEGITRVVYREDVDKITAVASELLKERRKQPRVVVEFPIKLGESGSGIARDLSASAIQIQTAVKLEPGDEVRVEIGWGDEPKQFSATVYRVDRTLIGDFTCVLHVEDERRPIAPGEPHDWTEWMFPYHGTGGLTFADTTLAVNFKLDTDTHQAIVALCPTGSWHGVAELFTVSEASAESNVLRAWQIDASPTNPFYQIAELEEVHLEELIQLRLRLSTDRSHWLTLAPEISGSRQ